MAKKASKKTVKKPAAKAKAKKAPLFPGFFKEKLAKTDPKVAQAITRELYRQQNEIELIASENIVSRAVLEAQGSEHLRDDLRLLARLAGLFSDAGMRARLRACQDDESLRATMLSAWSQADAT